MKISTISFLLQGDSIYLAEKLRGFGKGFLNGHGGKDEPGESPEQAAERELFQEARIKAEIIAKRDKVAVIDFYLAGVQIFECHVYFLREWQGTPVATEEMGEPILFPLSGMPFEKMMPSDRKWLPIIASGKRIRATVKYSEGFAEMIDFQFTEHAELE